MPTASERRRALQPAYDVARAQVEAGTVPFVILGVAGSDGVIRVEAVPGDARTADGRPVDTESICLLASITKPIVATAVMTQVAAGRVDLREPLATWAPSLVDPSWAPVTPWHILSHTSGLADIDLEALLRGNGDRAAMLRLISEGRQETPPGTRYRYASDTFDLLVEALATPLGRPFEAVLDEAVLRPLAMTSTTWNPADDPALAGRAATVLDHGDHGPVAQDEGLVDGFAALHLAGGGLWSTAGDLLRFGRAMLLGGELDGVRILSPAFVELMTREITVPRGSRMAGLGAQPDPLVSDHYALGWGRPGMAAAGSDEAFGHGGASGTRLWIDPAHDLVFVYLTGVWGLPVAPIDAVAHAIYAATVA